MNTIRHTAQFRFDSLAECKKEELPRVKKIFEHVSTPIYGEQPKLWQDIESRTERKTEILCADGKSVACLIYKRALSQEYEHEGLQDALEVSFVSLYHPNSDSEKGYQAQLVRRIEEVAREMRAKSIVYCLPEAHQERFIEFERQDFAKKYVKKSETLLECMFTKTLQKRQKIEAVQPQGKRHDLPLKQPYLGQVQSGVKTIEGRINSGGPAKFRVGDIIHFMGNGAECDCEIKKIEKFSGFREMLEKVEFKKCIPSATSVDQAFAAYSAISGYLERARKSGVLAIYIEKVNKK